MPRLSTSLLGNEDEHETHFDLCMIYDVWMINACRCWHYAYWEFMEAIHGGFDSPTPRTQTSIYVIGLFKGTTIKIYIYDFSRVLLKNWWVTLAWFPDTRFELNSCWRMEEFAWASWRLKWLAPLWLILYHPLGLWRGSPWKEFGNNFP